MESLWTNQHWIQGFSTHAASSVAAGATSGTSFQWLKSGTENDVLQDSKSVGFDAEKRRYFSVPWCWMEIDIPQHVLLNEESKVT